MLAMDDRSTEEAEHFFRRAIHIKQDFRSALFNLALLLADDHRPLEAAPFLNQLVKYHPDHVRISVFLCKRRVNSHEYLIFFPSTKINFERSFGHSIIEKLMLSGERVDSTG